MHKLFHIYSILLIQRLPLRVHLDMLITIDINIEIFKVSRINDIFLFSFSTLPQSKPRTDSNLQPIKRYSIPDNLSLLLWHNLLIDSNLLHRLHLLLKLLLNLFHLRNQNSFLRWLFSPTLFRIHRMMRIGTRRVHFMIQIVICFLIRVELGHVEFLSRTRFWSFWSDTSCLVLRCCYHLALFPTCHVLGFQLTLRSFQSRPDIIPLLLHI